MKLKPWGKTIVFCAAVFAALAAYKALQIRSMIAFAESFPEHSETVKSAYAQTVEYRKKISVIGEVKAPRTVTLFSETPGRIVKVGFRSGEQVAKGQVLLQQDISEEAALLDAARARRELAETNYQRNKDLFKSHAVSKEAYDSALVDLATVKADIARLESLIRKKTIKAPFAGKAGIHDFEEGMFLKDNVLVTKLVGAQDDLWIDFSVPQFYPLLEQGDSVEVRDLRNTSDDARPVWVSAQVIAISSEVDPGSRSYQYRASVAVSSFKAGVNSGVEVRLPVAPSRPVISVPATAVLQDHFRQYVYLLNPDEKSGAGKSGDGKPAEGKPAEGKPSAYRAVQQTVKVIGKEGGTAFISEGLEANQLVAADGAFKLNPGLLVHSDVVMSQDAGSGQPEAGAGKVDAGGQ